MISHLPEYLNVICFLVAVHRWQTLNDSKQEFPFARHFSLFHVKQRPTPAQEMRQSYEEFRATLSDEQYQDWIDSMLPEELSWKRFSESCSRRGI